MDYKSLALLTPEILLSILAIVIIVAESFAPKIRRFYVYLSIVGLIAAAGFICPVFCAQSLPWVGSLGINPIQIQGGWVQYALVFEMLSVDSLSLFFKLAILIVSVLILWLSLDYFEFKDVSMGTYSSLILLSTVGMMLLVSATDFLIAVIALELISVPSFILTGFVLNRKSATEGALKFFLVGTFSTALLLYGISFYYGYFGSTSIIPLLTFPSTGGSPDMALSLILVFLLAGVGFKLAMVPFHMWAPDAYEGAPTPITAFLSVAPKAAVIGFVLRLFAGHAELNLTPVLAVLAALTMTVGNIAALNQNNVKRLMAYSSIAQVGYILVAIVAGGPWGGQAAMLYTFLYLFMNLGVFTILIIVSNESQSEQLDVFSGLSKKSFGLSLMLVVFLLSLTGIPPLAGFIGKFAVFAAVIKTEGLLWLGIIAVLNSVISLYYYFKMAKYAFFNEPDSASPLTIKPALICCLVVALGVTVVAGIVPNSLIGWVRNVVGS